MGLNNEDSLRIILDIETASLPDAAQYLEPAEAPGNYKDPAKIADYIAAKNAENLDRAALDVDLCRIVAIGWMREDDPEPSVALVSDAPEELMLKRLWLDIDQRVTVGYATLGFDLPVLLRRSLYLGVQHPFVSLDKYRTDHIDLQLRLSYNGMLKWRSLDFYCRRFGIPCEDTTTGADIGAFVAAGEWDKVAAHCRADVLKTKALAERMGLIRIQIDQPEMVL